MSQHYSNPKREADPGALPDLEIWNDNVSIVHCRCGDYDMPYDCAHVESVTYCPSCEREAESIEDTNRLAWWWWFCFPGCMPEGSVNGPFDSEEEALEDAREGMED